MLVYFDRWAAPFELSSYGRQILLGETVIWHIYQLWLTVYDAINHKRTKVMLAQFPGRCIAQSCNILERDLSFTDKVIRPEKLLISQHQIGAKKDFQNFENEKNYKTNDYWIRDMWSTVIDKTRQKYNPPRNYNREPNFIHPKLHHFPHILEIKLLILLSVWDMAAYDPPPPELPDDWLYVCGVVTGELYVENCDCWKYRCVSAFVAAPKLSVVAVCLNSCFARDEDTLPKTLRPVFSSGESPRLVRTNPPVATATPAAPVAFAKSGSSSFARSCKTEVPKALVPATTNLGPAINGVAAPDKVPNTYAAGEEVIEVLGSATIFPLSLWSNTASVFPAPAAPVRGCAVQPFGFATSPYHMVYPCVLILECQQDLRTVPAH